MDLSKNNRSVKSENMYPTLQQGDIISRQVHPGGNHHFQI